MKKEQVWIREDKPEQNKIGVWKPIERVIRRTASGIPFIRWKGYKWAVARRSAKNYQLLYLLG